MSGFSTELESLEDIGKKYLPKGVENLQDAQSHIMESQIEGESYAFPGATDLYADVAKSYLAASSDLWDSIQRNQLMLDLASEAILEIAKRYAALDGQ